MAGGTWTSQSKIRPGAYINFKAVAKGSMTVGDRGVVAMGLPLTWGEEGKLIEVLSSDLLNGNSRKLIGFTAFDTEAKLLSAALSYCYKALVYRTNSGGAKASCTIGKLICTAKCSGTMGNKLNVTVSTDSTTGISTVITYLDGGIVDRQKVTSISELDDNEYIAFTEAESGTFVETAGTPLTGGTDGTATDSTAYPAMFNLLEMAKWQTFACLSSDSTIKANTVTFINKLRDDEGRYVQGVVSKYDAADSEGIINSVNGAVINNVTYDETAFVAVVAGMTAGASLNESNTAKVVSGATSIVGELTDAEIKAGLEKGQFIISPSTSGNIKVEQDINSLHNYTQDRNYTFSKNRVIRTLDEIGTTVKETWEDTYMGKVDNNDIGRGLFKSDLATYATELMRLNAIQNFETDDIEVSQGTDLDSVVVTWNIQPVDSMEKLYLTVNVSS